MHTFPGGDDKDYIIKAQVVDYSLRFLFEVVYGKNRIGSDQSSEI